MPGERGDVVLRHGVRVRQRERVDELVLHAPTVAPTVASAFAASTVASAYSASSIAAAALPAAAITTIYPPTVTAAAITTSNSATTVAGAPHDSQGSIRHLPWG